MKVSIKSIVVLGIFLFLCLALFTALFHKPCIERGLARTIHESLVEVNIFPDTVFCRNLEVTLDGTVNDSASWYLASHYSAAIPGVRLVENHLQVIPSPVHFSLQDTLQHITSVHPVTFVMNSSKLTEEGEAALIRIRKVLAFFPESEIAIAGYTDSQGDSAYNQRLSLARSETVLQWLIGHGQPENRFKIMGFGEQDPVADNSDPEGRAKNRRVHFTVHESGDNNGVSR